jgi:hypothetical protein
MVVIVFAKNDDNVAKRWNLERCHSYHANNSIADCYLRTFNLKNIQKEIIIKIKYDENRAIDFCMIFYCKYY